MSKYFKVVTKQENIKMKIQVKEKADNLSEDNWFNLIINTLENINCDIYVNNLTLLSSKEQKERIKELQNYLTEILKKKHSNFEWIKEHRIRQHRDSIDIYGEYNNQILIIELDKWRADQVAKKVLSRTALFIDKRIGLISLCYAGTKGMNKNECIKYFKYSNVICSQLGNYYAGLIIE